MKILISNIRNELVNDVIAITKAEKTILILNKKTELDIGTPYQVECLDIRDPVGASTQIRDIFSAALKEGEVELALEADFMGLQIQEAAKDHEIFRKKNIFVVKEGRIDKFKACLC